MSTTPKYDVAISFLATDTTIAAALEGRLRESGLTVFFFPRNQEELAGTNGMESMRQPFVREARLVVVLFREPWGETPWTRVEETAITDGCLALGWNRLFFVVLDATSKRRSWLPDTHVRFNYADFGLEQAVGAIKARVQELGGSFRPPTARDVAAQAKKEADFIRDREAFVRSDIGANTAFASVDRIVESITALAGEISRDYGIDLKAHRRPRAAGMTIGRVTLIVDMTGFYLNDIQEGRLEAREFNGRALLPGEQGMMLFSKPQLLRTVKFRPDLSQARQLIWIDEDKKESLDEAGVADRCVQNFLRLVQRAQRGELPDVSRL